MKRMISDGNLDLNKGGKNPRNGIFGVKYTILFFLVLFKDKPFKAKLIPMFCGVNNMQLQINEKVAKKSERQEQLYIIHGMVLYQFKLDSGKLRMHIIIITRISTIKVIIK